MQFINKKNIKQLVAIFGIVLSVMVFNSGASAKDDSLAPELPPECASIQVPAGQEVIFHAYAIGVQIYRWNGSAWTFVAPSAKLYADSGFNGEVGIHYEGPTWQSNSGSKVIGARVPNTGCSPDTTAVPWLLLQTVTTDGAGIFKKVTFIQRVKTAGGNAPSGGGTFNGEERRVPYSAEYYFYRAQRG